MSPGVRLISSPSSTSVVTPEGRRAFLESVHRAAELADGLALCARPTDAATRPGGHADRCGSSAHRPRMVGDSARYVAGEPTGSSAAVAARRRPVRVVRRKRSKIPTYRIVPVDGSARRLGAPDPKPYGRHHPDIVILADAGRARGGRRARWPSHNAGRRPPSAERRSPRRYERADALRGAHDAFASDLVLACDRARFRRDGGDVFVVKRPTTSASRLDEMGNPAGPSVSEGM